MNLIKAIAKPFNSQAITFYRDSDPAVIQDETLWTTGEQLGFALGYKNPRRSVHNLFVRYQNFLNPYTCVIKLMTQGQNRDVRFFNETGAHIIAVKANTPQSEAYILWLDQLAREYRRGLMQRLNSRMPFNTNYFPYLPNGQQLSEMRKIMGKEKAAEYVMLIVDAVLARHYLAKSKTPSQRLREEMKRQGITITKMSEMTGISQTSISFYCTHGKIPKKESQEKIAMALGLSREEIWGEGLVPVLGGREN